MGYVLLAYFVGLGIALAYDPVWGAYGIILTWILGAIIGAMAFCRSWTDVFIGIPVGLFLCACATI